MQSESDEIPEVTDSEEEKPVSCTNAQVVATSVFKVFRKP